MLSLTKEDNRSRKPRVSQQIMRTRPAACFLSSAGRLHLWSPSPALVTSYTCADRCPSQLRTGNRSAAARVIGTAVVHVAVGVIVG